MVLSYRHGFHAGNRGDVVKHSILSLLLCSLAAKKPKAFLYLDTHAAAGSYAFTPANSEYKTGIARLWSRRDLPRCLTPYLHAVRSINGFHPLPLAASPSHLSSSAPDDDDSISEEAATAFALPPVQPVFPDAAFSSASLQRYPGSPSLFLHLRRPQDRMLAYEAHSTEYGNLQRFVSTEQRSTALYPYYPPSALASPALSLRDSRAMPGDGLLSYSLFPQPERRGLCLVDPAYELPDEYEQVAPFLRRCVRRFASGVYCCWYPFIAGKEELSERMIAQMRDTGIPRMLHVRFSLRRFLADQLPSSASGGSGSQQSSLPSARQARRTSLYGCGLLIVNPPYMLQSLLSSSLLPFLSTALASEHTPAEWSVDWLQGEERRREGADITQTATGVEAASLSPQPAARLDG